MIRVARRQQAAGSMGDEARPVVVAVRGLQGQSHRAPWDDQKESMFSVKF